IPCNVYRFQFTLRLTYGMPMNKNQTRRARFQKIQAAIDSIYAEAAWRNRKGDHLFEMHQTPVDAPEVTSRAAGGPTMKTMQWDPGVRGIRGLGRLRDRLEELARTEKKTP